MEPLYQLGCGMTSRTMLQFNNQAIIICHLIIADLVEEEEKASYAKKNPTFILNCSVQ